MSSGEKKIGLERFLQLEEQRKGVVAILRNTHSQKVLTVSEWKEIVAHILHRKVK